MIINKFRAFLANQLGFPKGWFGKLLIRFLNRNNAVMNNLALQNLNLQAGDRVLEIGFGGGYLIEQIANTHLPQIIVGAEQSQDAIEICKQKFRTQINKSEIELHLADATELPFTDRAFDKICTVNTIYFWADLSKVFTECHRVLTENGKLLISYNSKDFLSKQKFAEHGFIGYEVAEIEASLKLAGFINVTTITGNSDRHQEFFCTSATAHLGN
ncbi:MAG: class I SAM-dependent methyltransferase [Pseudanabaena sp.]|nr:MAG: class I SAM-dependent methyltransferase [Pseudanabaena sp.]